MCVLLVEDEPIIQLAVCDALESAGHEVQTADNGDDAGRMIEQWPGRFTALVTDYRMPGGRLGTDIASIMRRSYPSIPIIIATGNPDQVSNDFRKNHDVMVITKPFEPNFLASRLADLFTN